MSRTPTTLSPSMSGLATGVEGHTCTVPALMTCAPTHCMNWPIESTRPSCLRRNGGTQGRFNAWCSNGSAQRQPRIIASVSRNAPDRRLAPIGSSRYAILSCLTGTAIGIWAGSSCG